MDDEHPRRTWLRGVAALAIATGADVSSGCAARLGPAASRSRTPGDIRVITLNLAHGRALAWTQSRARPASWYRANLDVIARMLARERPDVVALQEAELGSRWAGMFDHVAYLAERSELDVVTTMASVFVPGRWRYGTALLARGDVLTEGGAAFAAHGRWAKGCCFARLRVGGVLLTAASVHLDHASARVRSLQAAELADVLRDQPPPYVVLGDFNANWRGGAVREVAERLGLVGYQTDATQPSTYPLANRRLDWILASPELAFARYDVLTGDRLSDHRAVLADLRSARKSQT